MPSQSQDSLSDGLRLVSYCPVCETRVNPMQARPLGKEGETELLHIQCHKCHNAFLALVLVNQVGASSIGLVTDLAYEDVLRFKSNRSVSINDVISIHEFFEGHTWPKRFAERSRAVSRSKRKEVETK
jgi:hypothetical protein